MILQQMILRDAEKSLVTLISIPYKTLSLGRDFLNVIKDAYQKS